MLDADLENQTQRHPLRSNAPPILTAEGVSLWYGEKQALKGIYMEIPARGIVAFIGPSGCGKTTMLKCFNRMHDDTPHVRIEGRIEMDGADIHGEDVDPPLLRRRFGWVAQRPNPFERSIYDNVAYAPRLHGLVTEDKMDAHVQDCLERAFLWSEVKDRLHSHSGLSLSIGQQQRLCVARALSAMPEVLLMDEPTGSVDPIATEVLERLIAELGQDRAVIIVTHSMMEAKRLSDVVAYFHLGELVEYGPTDTVFAAPKDPRTKAFIEGAVG